MKKPLFTLFVAVACCLAACNKGSEIDSKVPEVTENSVVATTTTAVFLWKVDYPGKVSSVVTLSLHADMSDAVGYGDATPTDDKAFSVTVTGLTDGAKYYYRYEVRNPMGLDFTTDVFSFVTTPINYPIVSTTPIQTVGWTMVTVGGNVTDDGNADVTERGVFYGTSPNPNQTGTKVAAPSGGTGSFTVALTDLETETRYYVMAYAVNSKGTSYGTEASFTTLKDVEGAIKGVFSLSSNTKVCFSKGNLQFRASDGCWQFAEHQYDHIGNANSNISSSYNGFIDLFGWGTSGWNSGNTYYQPWSNYVSDGTVPDGELYGPHGNLDLVGPFANSDWGVYNPITNGGNVAGNWRTPTCPEWQYLFEGRSASTVNGTTNARYAKAKVAGYLGVILFPDNYMHPSDVAQPVGVNDKGITGWNGNSYSNADWTKIEKAGAVFLTTAGLRTRTNVDYVGTRCSYWSASSKGDEAAHWLYVGDYGLDTDPSWGGARYFGFAVRLVHDLE